MADDNKLKHALQSAEGALRDLECERDRKAREAADVVREEYRERISAARIRRAEAQKALRDHIDATSSHPWDGKRVFKIKEVYANCYSTRKIGEKRIEGIVEVVRQTSQFPANMNWARPSLGHVIVRKVKKDGTPSLQMHRTHGNIMEQWQLAE